MKWFFWLTVTIAAVVLQFLFVAFVIDILSDLRSRQKDLQSELTDATEDGDWLAQRLRPLADRALGDDVAVGLQYSLADDNLHRK